MNIILFVSKKKNSRKSTKALSLLLLQEILWRNEEKKTIAAVRLNQV
jgi:hypothetical protein